MVLVERLDKLGVWPPDSVRSRESPWLDRRCTLTAQQLERARAQKKLCPENNQMCTAWERGDWAAAWNQTLAPRRSHARCNESCLTRLLAAGQVCRPGLQPRVDSDLGLLRSMV